ncbi:MAG TPA: energy transducer TonB, partial [Burkholderiaceae bacterium]|nr:energy transducer TonB [Burkholderiaceae bacterium]
PPAAANHPHSAPEDPADPPAQANTHSLTPEPTAAQTTREDSAVAPAIVCPGYQEALAEHSPPRALLRSGQGGEVLVEFTVMRDGTLQDVHVVSSTNPRLNHWAISGVSRKLRCAPQPQPVKLRLPIRLRFD